MSRLRRLIHANEGSLTVEAVLVIPLICLLMVVFLRLGFYLRTVIDDSAAAGSAIRLRDEAGNLVVVVDEPHFGFLTGSKPARRIRDTDLLIDTGYALKEKIPTWFTKTD